MLVQEQNEMIAFLSEPASTHAQGPVQVIQKHISWIFLAGQGPFIGIWLAASPSSLWERVSARRSGPSDATVDVLARQLHPKRHSIGPADDRRGTADLPNLPCHSRRKQIRRRNSTGHYPPSTSVTFLAPGSSGWSSIANPLSRHMASIFSLSARTIPSTRPIFSTRA